MSSQPAEVEQALHVPQDADPPPPQIMKRPELRRYVQEWGQPEDPGFVATDEVLKRPPQGSNTARSPSAFKQKTQHAISTIA